MSTFSTYMERADTIAREAFSAILAAEDALRTAQTAKEQGPRRGGIQDAQTAAKAARLEADYLEAKQAADKVQRDLSDETMSKLNEIRQELAAAVNEAYSANPADVDPGTMTLLQSGILTPAEYEKLLIDAQEKDNLTMTRIIGQSAERAAEKYHQSDPEAQTLRILAHRVKDTGGGAYLSAYDAVMDVVKRCLRTSSMIKHYDDLVGETVRDL